MATLTASARRHLKASQFAGPNRSYPVEDRGHAVAAKARAHQQLNRGNLSMAQYRRILAKANKVLGK